VALDEGNRFHADKAVAEEIASCRITFGKYLMAAAVAVVAAIAIYWKLSR
jgi:hypothetical protein